MLLLPKLCFEKLTLAVAYLNVNGQWKVRKAVGGNYGYRDQISGFC